MPTSFREPLKNAASRWLTVVASAQEPEHM